jgi:hypothetical protein
MRNDIRRRYPVSKALARDSGVHLVEVEPVSAKRGCEISGEQRQVILVGECISRFGEIRDEFMLGIAVKLAHFILNRWNAGPMAGIITGTTRPRRLAGQRSQSPQRKHCRHADSRTPRPLLGRHECAPGRKAILLQPGAAIESGGARSEHLRSSVTGVLPPDCPET